MSIIMTINFHTLLLLAYFQQILIGLMHEMIYLHAIFNGTYIYNDTYNIFYHRSIFEEKFIK